MLIGLIIVSTINTSLSQDSVPITKGTPAPFSGILLNKSKAEQVRIELIERDQFKIFNQTLLENSDLQNKIINNQKKQVDILLKQNDNLVEKIEIKEKVSNIEKIVWFGLGIVSAGLSVYGASLLVK